MAGAGALDAPFLMTSAESLLITVAIIGAVPSDYDWFYSLKGCQSLDLTEGAGITVDDVSSTVTINPGTDYRLAPGSYVHGLLAVEKTSQRAQQVFDGAGTVTRSPNE